jgi:hypothetical protein
MLHRPAVSAHHALDDLLRDTRLVGYSARQALLSRIEHGAALAASDAVNGGGRCGDLIEDRLRMPEQFRAGLGERDAASCLAPGLNVFDVQSTSRAEGYARQVTLKGYDNMTGLGTPAGQNFIKALRAREK